jgi:hypothetical protein
MSLTITTIVCAYNESRLLPGCLYSLRSQTRPPVTPPAALRANVDIALTLYRNGTWAA